MAKFQIMHHFYYYLLELLTNTYINFTLKSCQLQKSGTRTEGIFYLSRDYDR